MRKVRADGHALKTDTMTTRAPDAMGSEYGPCRKTALSAVVRTMAPVVAMVFMMESASLMLRATSTPPSAPTAAQTAVVEAVDARGR